MTVTVAVDFDGVIHSYDKGWHDGTIYGPPNSGAIESLQALMAAGYAVFVFTSREVESVIPWLEGYGLPVAADGPPYPVFWDHADQILVTNRKLPAVAYVDDRALRFLDWTQTLHELQSFLPNWPAVWHDPRVDTAAPYDPAAGRFA